VHVLDLEQQQSNRCHCELVELFESETVLAEICVFAETFERVKPTRFALSLQWICQYNPGEFLVFATNPKALW
jgi:hypothetical protein